MATLHFYKNELIDLMEKSKSFWKLDKFGDLYKQELSKLHRLVTIIVYIYIALLTATCVQLAVLTLIFRRGKPIFLCYGGLYGLESPHYEIYSILDAIGIGVISIAVSGYDAMFFFFALDIYTEFKMIKSAFKRHSDQTVSSYNKQFIEAVKHHDFLLQYINQVNDIFSPMFLFQFFSGLLGICFSLFMISRSGLQDINTLSIYSAGLLGFTAQSYTFCLVGEVISELSEDISNEIFYTDWLDDEVYRNKTAILIVMNRAQESPKLTIGKFADMNLRTFIMAIAITMKQALKLADVLGFNPLKNDNLTKLKKYSSLICMISVVVSAILEFVSNFSALETYESAPESLVPQFQTLAKISSLLLSQKDITELIDEIKYFWKLDQFGDFHTRKLKKIYKYVTIFFYFYTLMLSGACVLFTITTVIFTPEKPLFLCYGGLHGLPSPQFEIYFVVDLAAIVIMSFGVAAYDGIFFYFAFHVYAEFKLVKVAFKGKSTFIEAVKHHDFLLKYLRKLNEIYSPIFLCQFFSNLLGICFCLFMLSRSGMPPELTSFSKYFISLVAFTVQTYIFCLIGDLVSELSLDISNVIFYVDWLDDEVYKSKTARLVIMNKAQSPVKLTIGKFTGMDLRTFLLV
ncbi:hypothetical protein TcasGA2_TC034194 [Tribolium castaneum]|uniref:Odorant receptor n=1 Tax=Tribolium castaneum TaxID=7070 RepID=A0A139WCV0_TRICA|nr:hypothetical protein TcasGA2_TC034194 [Tribolium castaneum]